MKNLYLSKFLLIAALSMTCTNNAHAIFGWNKQPTSLEQQAAERNFKAAQKSIDIIKHKEKKTGYSPAYALSANKDTLYADLAANPADVSLYADFSSKIYDAVALVDGKHLQIDQVADAIGDDLLASTGYSVLGSFERWGQFSGALLYNQRQNTMLIVFAGTASKLDVHNDLKFTRHADNEQFGLIPQNYNVHKGVALALLDSLPGFQALFDNIVEVALTKGDVKVITTGHSLGGAISLLAADYIKRQYVDAHNIKAAQYAMSQGFIGRGNEVKANQIKVSNISFAAPRIFSKQTALQVENNLGKGNVIRFWNSVDIVPAIVAGYLTNSKHVGLDFKIDDSYFRRVVPGLGWHSMTWYADNAQNTFERYVVEAQHRRAVEAEYADAVQQVAKYKNK